MFRLLRGHLRSRRDHPAHRASPRRRGSGLRRCLGPTREQGAERGGVDAVREAQRGDSRPYGVARIRFLAIWKTTGRDTAETLLPPRRVGVTFHDAPINHQSVAGDFHSHSRLITAVAGPVVAADATALNNMAWNIGPRDLRIVCPANRVDWPLRRRSRTSTTALRPRWLPRNAA